MIYGDTDTICALATPLGTSGIAVIRMSGPQSFSIIKKLAPFLAEKIESHRIYHGVLVSSQENADLDEVLIFPFAKGKSYTGDETVEISCHGNTHIIRKILSELVLCGARAAQRGEFTYRAFMNGNLDLTQAESVLSLIESKSDLAIRQSLRQLKGGLSEKLISIEDQLIWCSANIEAAIDFSTEDIEVVSYDKLNTTLINICNEVDSLLKTFKTGKLINDGLKIAIIGEPNVGKSSLLNLLIQENRAIVTDIPGTTRDLIEGEMAIKGIRVKLIDTAGIRESVDVVEQEGIARSISIIKEADLIFSVLECNKPINKEVFSKLNDQPKIIIVNKFDLYSDTLNKQDIVEKVEGEIGTNATVIVVSAKSAIDRDLIIREIEKFLSINEFSDESCISNVRQLEGLQNCQQSLFRAKGLLESKSSFEFIALELKEALLKIQEIQGKRYDDQILDRVFKEFCLGK